MTTRSNIQSVVLDSSALIAFLGDEDGADIVEPLVNASAMSFVNLAEVFQWGVRHGHQMDSLHDRIWRTRIRLVEYTLHHALDTAEMFLHTQPSGLGIGDRACLALARELAIPAITADRRWTEVDVGVEVRLIR